MGQATEINCFRY